MKQLVFSAGNDCTGFILRLAIGLVLFPHGAQKLTGWFGGYGFNGMMDYLTNKVHLPWFIAFMVIMIEFFGSLLLIAGFASRILAALIVVLFIGVIVTHHLQNGFFMNWFNNQPGEGYEFDLLMIFLSLALLVQGSGRYSVDGIIARSLSVRPYEVAR